MDSKFPYYVAVLLIATAISGIAVLVTDDGSQPVEETHAEAAEKGHGVTEHAGSAHAEPAAETDSPSTLTLGEEAQNTNSENGESENTGGSDTNDAFDPHTPPASAPQEQTDDAGIFDTDGDPPDFDIHQRLDLPQLQLQNIIPTQPGQVIYQREDETDGAAP